MPRAIKNEIFVIAPCAAGLVDGGRECYEHSLLVNSWGKILADSGVSPERIQTIIDLDQTGWSRNKIQTLTNNRPYDLAQKS